MKFKQIMFAICSLAIAGAAVADTQGPQWQLLAPDQMPAKSQVAPVASLTPSSVALSQTKPAKPPAPAPSRPKLISKPISAKAPSAVPAQKIMAHQAKVPMSKLASIGPARDRYYPGANLVHKRPISVLVNTGSLKHIVTRIAHNHGWYTVEWNSPNDYLWVGKTRITAANLPGVFDKLLSDYPVQAQFYQGNHVLAIEPRTLK